MSEFKCRREKVSVATFRLPQLPAAASLWHCGFPEISAPEGHPRHVTHSFIACTLSLTCDVDVPLQGR